MDLNKLFQKQAELDERIIEEHNLHNQDLKKKKVLAGIVEMAETVNEARFFKFWSTDQKARTSELDAANYDEDKKEWIIINKNPLLEEYVDTIHFIISIGLEYGYTEHTYKQPKMTDLTDRTLDIVYLLSSLPHTLENARNKHIGLIFDYVIALGEQFGFDEQMVINAYYTKNKINHARQESGY